MSFPQHTFSPKVTVTLTEQFVLITVFWNVLCMPEVQGTKLSKFLVRLLVNIFFYT